MCLARRSQNLGHTNNLYGSFKLRVMKQKCSGGAQWKMCSLVRYFFPPGHSSSTRMVTIMQAAGEGVIYTPEHSDGNCMAAAMIAQVEVRYPSG